jgi:glycerol-3-phosphate cytidylyltransferase-like family protein
VVVRKHVKLNIGMKQVVIMPGGFHPFHAGHMALYNSARKAFPQADVYVAATDDTSTRPFPFAVKEKLARLAGVEPGKFVKVKSPFSAEEITQNYDPNQDIVIFVRSEKDRSAKPQPGGIKKDGTPSKLQPLSKDPKPFGQHVYMTYLPTVEFGPGLTSATEIRNAWPKLSDRRKQAMVMSLYPATQKNPALAKNVVGLLDSAILGAQESFSYPSNPEAVAKQKKAMTRPVSTSEYNVKSFAYQGYTIKYYPDRVEIYHGGDLIYQKPGDYSNPNKAQHSLIKSRITNLVRTKPTIENQDYIEEKWSEKYKRSINCNNPKGFSQKAHCAGRKKK